MEHYHFTNSDIDLTCEEVGKFLAASGIDRREVIRTKLTLEEVLLEYQAEFGVEAAFTVKCVKRLSSVKVELVVLGKPCDPLYTDGEEGSIIQGLLAGIGLAPTYSYKHGKNYIVFILKKKPLSGTIKMVMAVFLAIVLGTVLTLLPEEIRMGANEYLLTPATDAFMGIISAVSVPLIFLSVLGSICSMGNIETLGKIGGKTVKTILLYMTVISFCVTMLAGMFYSVQWREGGGSDFSQIVDMLFDIVPSSLFEPFITGNALQLIFIAVIVGLAMLALAARAEGVFKLVSEFSSIVQTMMSGISSMLHVLIFLLLTGMISSGEFDGFIKSFKMILIVMLFLATIYTANLLRIAIAKKVSPILLFKKGWMTLIVALSTASSAATFGTNVRDLQRNFGVDKKIAEFGIPLGQVLFKPSIVVTMIAFELFLADMYGISITSSFLIIAMITNMLLSFAVPPVPGGSVMCYTIAFAQLGIPAEAIGIVLALDTILDFPSTACDVSVWQISMIEVADSLHMLDKKTLHKKM